MEIFLWYTGILVLIYVAFAAYVFMGGNFGKKRDKADANTLYAFVGFGIVPLLSAIILGGAAMVLWQRFVIHDASISTLVWVLAAICWLGVIPHILRFVKACLAPPTTLDTIIQPDDKDQAQ